MTSESRKRKLEKKRKAKEKVKRKAEDVNTHREDSR